MSSLWTPGGEVPVDRERPSGPGPDAGAEPDTASLDDAELQARYAEVQRQVLEAPAAEVVVQHAAGLYELAAVHLSQDQVRLAEVRLLVDAVAALVDGLGDRLGESGRALAEALPQLKMAYVQATDRAAGNAPSATGDPGDVG